MKTVNMALLVAFFVTTLMAYANDSSTVIQNQITQTNIVKVTFKLKKFNQSCCSRIVEYGLKEVEGYIKSESHTDKQEITVWYDSSKCTEADIIKAINTTGYPVINPQK